MHRLRLRRKHCLRIAARIRHCKSKPQQNAACWRRELSCPVALNSPAGCSFMFPARSAKFMRKSMNLPAPPVLQHGLLLSSWRLQRLFAAERLRGRTAEVYFECYFGTERSAFRLNLRLSSGLRTCTWCIQSCDFRAGTVEAYPSRSTCGLNVVKIASRKLLDGGRKSQVFFVCKDGVSGNKEQGICFFRQPPLQVPYICGKDCKFGVADPLHPLPFGWRGVLERPNLQNAQHYDIPGVSFSACFVSSCDMLQLY